MPNPLTRRPVEGSHVLRALILVAGLIAAGSAPALAQTTPQGSVATPPAPVASTLDPESATQEFLARLTPEERARSDAYFEGGYWLQLWDFLLAIGVAWLLLGTRLSARLRDTFERLTRMKWLQTALYAMAYVVITSVLVFPMTVYEGFFREHAYHLSNQTFGQWFSEALIGLGVGLVLTPLALVTLYAVLRRASKSWWIWGSGVAIAFSALLSLIFPVFIAPFFNTYTPLNDSPLRRQILSLARANGIPATDVYQVDASRQSKRVSANVSGFLGTLRISLNDNLLKRCTPEEIQAVMGHEMGHYALHHVYKGLIFLSVVIVVGFAFVRWAFERVISGFGKPWGIRGIGDVAGLPLLSALLTVFFFVTTPIQNTETRIAEAEADLFGLNATRQPDGAAAVALKLGEYRKMSPGPIEEWIFFDHPSGRNRIRMAMRWKAEHLGEPPPVSTAPSP